MPQTGTGNGRWSPNPGRLGRLTHRVIRLGSSYRTVAVVGAVLVAAHAAWLVRSSHAGEVVSGFGASLVVLGVWVAAFPLMRRGFARTGPEGPRYIDSVLPEFRHFVERLEAQQERVKLRRDQIDERVIGVALALLGTLLNGYGTPLARIVGLES